MVARGYYARRARLTAAQRQALVALYEVAAGFQDVGAVRWVPGGVAEAAVAHRLWERRQLVRHTEMGRPAWYTLTTRGQAVARQLRAQRAS